MTAGVKAEFKTRQEEIKQELILVEEEQLKTKLDEIKTTKNKTE